MDVCTKSPQARLQERSWWMDVQKYKSTKVQKYQMYKSTWEAPRGKSLDGCTRVLEENVDDGKGVALLAIAW